MNKRSRKTAGLSRRLIAWLLCCVCLFGAVSVSAITLRAEASPMTEEATASTETTAPAETTLPSETTAPAETTVPMETVPETTAESAGDSDEKETAAPTEETAAPTEETAAPAEETDEPMAEVEDTETVDPSQGTDETEEVPVKTPAEVLFDRLMACNTFKELDDALNALTKEEQALLDQFTDQQNAELNAKIKALGGSGIVTLADESLTIEQGGTKQITVNNLRTIVSCNSEPEATIKAEKAGSGYTISVGSDVPVGEYKLTVTYTTRWLRWTNSHTIQVVAPAQTEAESAQVYYLKTPTSNPDSNETNQWGTTVGIGKVEIGKDATWTNNKNLLNPKDYVTAMPDGFIKQENGSWLMPRDEYLEHYEAIFQAYKAELEKTLGEQLQSVDDIEEIYLIPYKISKDNGSTPDKHIDCTISVKTRSVFVAKFLVTKPNNEQVQVDAKNLLQGSPVEKTDKAPSTEYPQEMKIDGITYIFSGWYNEAGQMIPPDGWPYTPSEEELDDGTVYFYARYERKDAKLTITKTVSGNMYDANDRFTFDVTYGGTTQSIELGKDGSQTISIPNGAAVTITERDSGYKFEVTAVTPGTLLYKTGERSVSFTMPDVDATVTINNDKSITVDTGVVLDTLPYVLLLGFAAAGAVLLVRMRHGRYDG